MGCSCDMTFSNDVIIGLILQKRILLPAYDELKNSKVAQKELSI